MNVTAENALAALAGKWGVASTEAQTALATALSSALEQQGINAFDVTIRHNRATITVAPHHAHLADLMLEKLALIAAKTTNNQVTQVRIVSGRPPSHPTPGGNPHE